MGFMLQYTSIVNIPAYDSSNNALVIEFKLTTVSYEHFFINTTGTVAAALQRNLKRIVEIMVSIKKSWECFESIGYLLECNSNQFVVRDSKSSSMALCIALINLYRSIHGQPQIAGLSGTGILRIDGSFDSSHLEEKKYLAAKNSLKDLNKFITPYESKNLFELEKLINQL